MLRSLEKKEKISILPKREEAISYYNNYSESNTLLNKKFSLANSISVFNEEFSEYPEESADKWTEEISDEVIRFLLKIIDQRMDIVSVDDLRESARLVGWRRPDLAARLLLAVRRLQPRNVRTGKKLTMLEQVQSHTSIGSKLLWWRTKG